MTPLCLCLVLPGFGDASPPDGDVLVFRSLQEVLFSLSLPASVFNVTPSPSSVSPIKAHSGHYGGGRRRQQPTRVRQIPLFVAERTQVRRILVCPAILVFVQDS